MPGIEVLRAKRLRVFDAPRRRLDTREDGEEAGPERGTEEVCHEGYNEAAELREDMHPVFFPKLEKGRRVGESGFPKIGLLDSHLERI
jgi:hypothetical protein